MPWWLCEVAATGDVVAAELSQSTLQKVGVDHLGDGIHSVSLMKKNITQWCQASDDWYAPYAENDLRTGGKFKTTMAAKDGSMSFDFEGVYSNVQPHKVIEYTIGDGRKVAIQFSGKGNETKV